MPRVSFSGTFDATQIPSAPPGTTITLTFRAVDSAGQVGTATRQVVLPGGDVPPPPPPPPPDNRAPVNDSLPTVSGTPRVGTQLTGNQGTWHEPDVSEPPEIPVNTAVPTISGTFREGNTLSSTTGTWTGTGITFTRQWQLCDEVGVNCTELDAATGSTLALTSTHVDGRVRLRVTATTASGGQATATSAASPVITAAASPPPPPPPPPPSGGDTVIRPGDVAHFMSQIQGASNKRFVIDGRYDLGSQTIRSTNNIEIVALRPATLTPVETGWPRTGRITASAQVVTRANNMFQNCQGLYLEGLDLSGPRTDAAGTTSTGHICNQCGNLEIVLCHLHDAQASALGGNQRTWLRRTEVSRNAVGGNLGHNAGGVKSVFGGSGFAENQIGMLCEYVYSHNNAGPGLWGDRDCDYFTFRYCICSNNGRAGIRWEIGAHVPTHTQHAEAYCNRLFGNGDGNPDRGGLVCNSANGMHAHDNTVGPNVSGHGLGITGSRHPTPNNRAINNRMLGGDNVYTAGSGNNWAQNTGNSSGTNVTCPG
jgi:hypothetical protein